ncbi:MAG: imidazole glycerol phosphate synthase subunit HisH [Flavobacteriales bacterium]|jgi:glutamine amidotransferase|tara:strand:- start:2957 stop:3544 length:588 start_codon:yes stop_codon:yes gene_type:complete
MNVVIVDYGAGNTQSVKFALKRLGCNGILTSDKEKILKSDRVIFPGVGEASSAIKKLRSKELDKLIPMLKQPVLGICLGMQLLCKFSEEGNTKCLGVFDVSVKRFNDKLKVPQVGWNTISSLKTKLFEGVLENEYMYLVHSYYVPVIKETIAISHYGCRYSTSIYKNNFTGVQFHPEKSANVGGIVLNNFLINKK